MRKRGIKFVVVFKTARVYEWDSAKAHLEESGVPCFGQIHTSTGLVEAMSNPAPGPGVSFALLVPRDLVGRASELLRELNLPPLSEREFWHFNSSSWARSWWRRLAIASLIVGLLLAAKELSDALSR